LSHNHNISIFSIQSAFLQTVLQELRSSSGSSQTSGRLSYCSQDPWIFSGTIRQNILFGKEYENAFFDSVISASILDSDLREFPNGDLTYVGERGIMLSGGQKARVNLARALYNAADIYLLDDPLSAVDTRVSRQIFERCIIDHLRERLRILVTHQLQYLPYADHIIVMSKVRVTKFSR
jgi:ATP-binding cassette subfamily C (CFTR/MRP) protein 4